MSFREVITAVLVMLSFFAAATATGWAIVSLYVNSFHPVSPLASVGAVYAILAFLWVGAGRGILHHQRWGRDLGLFAALAAVFNGVYRLSLTPTLGGLAWYDLGLWVSTTIGGIGLACLLLFSAVQR